jgi:hypothetical protein
VKENLQIISIDLISAYLKHIPKTLQSTFNLLEDAEISTETFSFYVSVSSVFSSKIEGENIELDHGSIFEKLWHYITIYPFSKMCTCLSWCSAIF